MILPDDDRINSLEHDLERSLRPVHPDPDFVNRLHDRLVTPTEMVLERQRPPMYDLAVILIGMGLALGLFMVWIVRQLR
jgi:hypothetical protein